MDLLDQLLAGGEGVDDAPVLLAREVADRSLADLVRVVHAAHVVLVVLEQLGDVPSSAVLDRRVRDLLDGPDLCALKHLPEERRVGRIVSARERVHAEADRVVLEEQRVDGLDARGEALDVVRERRRVVDQLRPGVAERVLELHAAELANHHDETAKLGAHVLDEHVLREERAVFRTSARCDVVALQHVPELWVVEGFLGHAPAPVDVVASGLGQRVLTRGDAERRARRRGRRACR